MPAYRGVVPVLATPFHDDESLDLESLARLVRFMREVRVDGVTVLGVLGEADRLSEDERERVVEAAVKAAGPLPVIAGATRPDAESAVKFLRRLRDVGASGAMVAPPGAQSLDHFRAAGQAGLPLVVQDHPASSGVTMPPEFIARLVREVPAVAGIKCEAPPTAAKVAQVKRALVAVRQVPILTGLGALYARFEREAGCDGFNTGFAFPEVLREMLGPNLARVYARYLPLLVFEQQPGPGVRKEMLRRRGLIRSRKVRSPGATLDQASAETVGRLLEETFPNQDLARPVRVRID